MALPSISLCMIVKDEENFIDKCLSSVKDVVKEIIIVDTGSKDGTVDICKKHNARIYPYTWNNHFADARNFGVSKASGDYILWLDADEELETGHEQLLFDTLTESNADMYFMPIINYYGESFPVQKEQAFLYHQPRLFKNHIGIQFYNAIHESPLFPKGKNEEYIIKDIQIPIHHYGYIEQLTKQKKKGQRNLELIQQEYNKPDHSPWIEYHLANEYYRQGDVHTAFEYLNQSIFRFLLEGIKPPSILYRLKYGIIVDTQSFDDALPGIDKAITLYPDYVDLHYLKGIILYQTNNFKEALECFKKCLELGDHHPNYLILKGTGSFKAQHYKNLCIEKLKSE